MRKIQLPDMIGRQEREDALSAYRDRVMSSLAIVAVIFLIPFAINNLIQGRYAVATGVLFALVILCADAVAIYLKRPPPIPLGLLIIPTVAGIAVSLKTQGFYGALWSYPVVLLFHFAMPRLKANLYCGAQLLAVTLLVLHYTGLDFAIRFAVTLALTIILMNIALNIIDDLHHRLIEQTILDPLTGAFNRRHMESCLAYTIERSRRAAAPAALLLIDIDYFKRINDRLGHAAGDKVLKWLVVIVGNRARKLDLLFRIGGEEFLLLLPDTREADAVKVGEDLRAAVAEGSLLQQWPVTVSIGVSELQAGQSVDAWLKQTDDALYRAKQGGRDCVVRHAPSVEAPPP